MFRLSFFLFFSLSHRGHHEHGEDLVAQALHLPTLTEEDEEDATTIKDEHGQLELHRAAQQPGIHVLSS